MPKKSKGSKGKKSRSRGRGTKGKKKSKKGNKGKSKDDKTTSANSKVPESDVFLWVRRKTTSLFIEGTEDLTIKDLKLMVSTIYGYFPEDISLFKNSEEMVEKKDLKKKTEEKGKGGSKSSVKSGSSGSRRSSKDKRGNKSKDKRGKSGGKHAADKDKKEEGPMVQIFTLGTYGFNARSSSLFNPGTIGLVFRDKNGIFEPLEITPWTKPVEIPDNVKPYLRNYNVEPTPEDLDADAPAKPTKPKSVKALAEKKKSTV